MKVLGYLLLSLAAACGVYALGAVVWSMIDPHGAGETLLFTIPIALGGMAIPGILGTLCLVFRGVFVTEPRRQAKRMTRVTPRPTPHVKPAHLPPRPRTRPRLAHAA
jgi:hypothetical protein